MIIIVKFPRTVKSAGKLNILDYKNLKIPSEVREYDKGTLKKLLNERCFDKDSFRVINEYLFLRKQISGKKPPETECTRVGRLMH